MSKAIEKESLYKDTGYEPEIIITGSGGFAVVSIDTEELMKTDGFKRQVRALERMKIKDRK